MRTVPTLERLKKLVSYDPVTGRWTALIAAGSRRKTGLIPLNNGRKHLQIDGHQYSCSRLAWLYMTGKWPTALIDHKNLNPLDDRWENLRQANKSQNAVNCKLVATNKSGVKGVSWCKRERKWRAYVKVDQRFYSLGYFSDLESAKNARQAAANYAFGEFARHE